MTPKYTGSAVALLAAVCAAPVAAQSADDIIVQTSRLPAAHGPAGTMGDHVHKAGELLIGASWTHEAYGGANRSGTVPQSPADLAAAGYSAFASSMTMDMAMLHLMWAPSDRLTLMAMPMWMRMDMNMAGTRRSPMMPVGRTMKHDVEGLGDTEVTALVALSRQPALSVHAGLGVSVPTGSVTKRNPDGTFMHYMMQPGSGTWDLRPSLTARGEAGGFGWGAQASYLFRAQKANDSGYLLGDRFAATGWLSMPLSRWVALSARTAFTTEGAIRGHYSGAHHHGSPPDRQANYGGDRVDLGGGLNIATPGGWRLNVEAMVPMHQRLRGVQLPRQWSTAVNVSKTF